MAKKKKAARRRRAPSRVRRAGAPVTVRHYCQGIGDCHLLKFTRDDGRPFYMLIDCGVHSAVSGGSDTIARIVDDIAAVTGTIDVVVATHEHWDHISGFFTAAEQFRKKIKVGEVWMGWTEDPADPQARALDKFKGQALAALQETSLALDRARGLSPHLFAVRAGLRGVLGFNFGAKGEKVRSARDAVMALAPGREKYLEPGDKPIDLPGLSNLRIYVLGPPRDPAMLGIRERAAEMYGLAGMDGWPVANALDNAFRAAQGTLSPEGDWAAPFDANVGTSLSRMLDPKRDGDGPDERAIADFVRDRYAGPARDGATRARAGKSGPDAGVPDQSWRRIDMDWLGIGADLAIQLDDRTNNSSVVLAFEFVDTGRVMLFTADAQVGSWLSWQDLKWGTGDKAVTGPGLLARTVYYKVGHHGSHNATLKQKGLELMTDKDLAAFVPTNATDAKKVRWNEMPFQDILDALAERGSARVIRADDPWIATTKVDPRFRSPSGSIRAVRHKKDLWVELDIA
jgi:hypothetical protein